MGTQIAENFYFRGQGQFYLGRRLPSGRPECLHAVGNVSEASLAFAVNTTEHQSSQGCTRSTDLTILDSVNGTLNMTLESLDPRNLELAMYGENETLAAGQAATEEVVVSEIGCWYPVDFVGLTAGTVSLTHATTSALVEDTDFQVDYTAGLFRLLDTPETQALTFPYTETVQFDYPEQNKIEGLTNSSAPERFIRFAGLNTLTDCTPLVIDVYRVAVDPLAGLPMLATDVAQMPLTMRILQDTTRTEGSQFFTTRGIFVPAVGVAA